MHTMHSEIEKKTRLLSIKAVNYGMSYLTKLNG